MLKLNYRLSSFLPLVLWYVFADAQTTGFAKPVYEPLPLHAIQPKGWLLHQLQIMRDGSTGHLDETYEKLKDDNGWLGGIGDGWEETPYWLDGATPLAYLLNDEPLKQKVLKYINWTLDHQRPSGYFGPLTKAEKKNNLPVDVQHCSTGEDWWPKMVMLKVLQQYYSATGDQRVIRFMSKYFFYQLNTVAACPVGKWTKWSEARGVENIMMVIWLYQHTKDPSLIKLATVLHRQSFPWTSWFEGRDWVMQAAAQQNGEHVMERHSVNVAMGLKDPVINYLRTGNKKYIPIQKTAFTDLMLLHGLPMGVFSGDEDLHGNETSQGTELCTVVETMYSLENIIGVTGDIKYMDALERIAFNALPAQTSDDYNFKQYFQIPNQVQVARGALQFSETQLNGMSNVFGTKSGYTCCLTNMHQGWTKYAAHLWYSFAGNGLAALTYGPSEIKATIKGAQVKIEERTDYPFGDQIHFIFSMKSSVAFPMQLRIPAWCREAKVLLNGQVLHTEKGGQLITISRTWKDGDELSLELPMELFTSNWARNSRTVERGPLVYALKLPEEWKKDHHEIAGDYFSIYSGADWNYGLLQRIIKNPASGLTVHLKPLPENFIWNQSMTPVQITASAKKLPDWKLTEDGILYQPVSDRSGLYKGVVNEKTEQITLIPFGCTKIRVVAFPVVSDK